MRTKTIILGLFSLIIGSCKTDCRTLESVYKDTECIIIVKEIPNSERTAYFTIIGNSPISGKDTIYNDDNRWFTQYYRDISVNDTIFKMKGSLHFTIHKKDSIISHKWHCKE